MMGQLLMVPMPSTCACGGELPAVPVSRMLRAGEAGGGLCSNHCSTKFGIWGAFLSSNTIQK